MIKLDKGPTPPQLEGLLAGWTDELLAAIECGNEERRKVIERHYSDRRLKTALLEETSGKCAYCESRVNDTAYPRVDHIMPRRVAPELTFAWSNLTIACEICNGRKGDYWDLALPLIDPLTEDPSRHLWAPDQLLKAWRNSLRGAFAISRLDLNRPGLIERRTLRLDRVQALIDQWRDASTHEQKAGYWHALQRELADGKEYLLMIRAVIRGIMADAHEAHDSP